MGKYNFDFSIDRRKTYSARWGVTENELPLNIADMDFEVLPEIKEAIKNRAELDCYGYIDTPKSYFEAYISWWKRRHDVELKLEWFSFSTSVVGSIDSILKRICKPNDQVVLFTPVYNVFFNCIRNNHLIVRECDLLEKDNSFEIDWDKFENILKEESTKAFILCNPHNPVGKGFSVSELDRIINLCAKYNVYLISDEIHCDLDMNIERYNSIFESRYSGYKNIILLISPTKVFNIAGLQSSAVVVKDKELHELVQNGLYQDDIGEPNYFAVDPIIAAYNFGDDYVNELNEYIKENKRIFSENLDKNASKLKIKGGNFTYLIWIDISYFGLDSKTFCERLKQETGLIVAPGINYGSNFDSFIRINLASPRKNIVDACHRLNSFISKIEGERK